MDLEKKIEKAWVKRAEAHGWFCPKYKNDSRRAAPDRIALRGGDPLPDWGNEAPAEIRFIEWKQPGKTPTDQQWLYLLDLRERGFIADWSDSVARGMDILENTHKTWEPPKGFMEPI